MKTPELETERLLLRGLRMDDAPAVQKHFNNWNIIKNIGSEVPWPYPENGAHDYLADILSEDQKETHIWGILLKDGSKEVIGTIEYRLADDEDDNRGFSLAEPFWRRGIMSEAIAATQDFVFFEVGKERLIVRSLRSNTGSKIIKERTGAKLIGRSEGKYHTRDTIEDVWEITRDSWEAVRSRRQH